MLPFEKKIVFKFETKPLQTINYNVYLYLVKQINEENRYLIFSLSKFHFKFHHAYE